MNNTAGRGALHVCLAALLLLLLACACAAAEDNALLISEAQSNNDTDWALGFHDYIELHNGGDSAVMLSDYFLTLDEADPFACHLPAVELAPDGDALLICDVDLRGLRLPKEGCSLFLFDRDGTLCDSAVLPAMENNVWQAEWGLTRQPSPGYANTEQGAAAYRASLAAQQTLVVSEVVSSNSTLLELNGETNDLIELQNIGSQTISLSDYYLSDKKKNPFLWQLPDVQLEPGACYVVQASGSGNGQGRRSRSPPPVSGSTSATGTGSAWTRCMCRRCPRIPPTAEAATRCATLRFRPSAFPIRTGRRASPIRRRPAWTAARCARPKPSPCMARARFTTRSTAERPRRAAAATTARPFRLPTAACCACARWRRASSGRTRQPITIWLMRRSTSFRFCASAASWGQSSARMVSIRSMKTAAGRRRSI